MPKYLTIHNESDIDRVLLESRWTEIATDHRAEWQMTLYTTDLGRRWCEWDAPDRGTIEQIFDELGIKWTEIIEVEMTTASRWRLWEVESGTRMKNCWEVTDCGREPESWDSVDASFCPAAVADDRMIAERPQGTGRFCWKVVGAICQEKDQGTLHEKRIESGNCPFFGPVDLDDVHRFHS